jgi:hypothetical protein
MSFMLTFPAPPPPPLLCDDEFVAPHENDSISIHFSWPFATLSPLMPV